MNSRSTLFKMIVAMGVLLVAVSGCGRHDASHPASPAGDMVEIDIYSGQANPVVQLDAAVATELYAMLSDQEAAGLLVPGDLPASVLGFRGFVVTPADATLPVLRIMPSEVFLVRDGNPQSLPDMGSEFYNRVYVAIRSLVGADILDAIPNTNPPIPNVTADIPPQIGAPATWTLADPSQVNPESTSIDVLVTRTDCSNGKTGEILKPVVSVGSGDIVIRADAVPLPDDAYNCLGNDSVAVTVQLPEPIGQRRLIDAICLSGQAIRYSYCQDSGIRWKP